MNDSSPAKAAVDHPTTSQHSARDRLILLLMMVSAIIHIGISMLLGPLVVNDSSRYAAVGVRTPTLDLLGTQGTGAPLVQLLWRLPANLAIGIQAIVGATAWGFLAYVGLKVIGDRSGKTLWLIVVTILYWSPLIVIVDATVLTESLAISGSLVCVTGTACIVSRRARVALPSSILFPATLTGFAVAVLSRPVTLIALAPLVLVVFFICSVGRVYRTTYLFACAFVALLISSYALMLGANVSHSQPELYRAENRTALRASVGWIDAARRTGFSDCPELTASDLISNAHQAYVWISIGPLNLRRLDKESAPRAIQAVRTSPCQETVSWLNDRHLTPMEQLIYVPEDSVKGYVHDAMRWWSEAPLGGTSLLAFQRAGSALLAVVDFAAFALLIVVAKRVLTLRRSGHVPKASLALAGIVFKSWFVFSVAVWLSDSIELSRHFLPMHLTFPPFALLTYVLCRRPPMATAATRRP